MCLKSAVTKAEDGRSMKECFSERFHTHETVAEAQEAWMRNKDRTALIYVENGVYTLTVESTRLSMTSQTTLEGTLNILREYPKLVIHMSTDEYLQFL